MTTQPEPQPITLTWVSPFRPPLVKLAVMEVPGADRVTLDCEAGQAPKVFLEFGGEVPPDVLELEGVVHVVREIPADPLKAVQDFLAAIDADELDKAVLEVLEFGPEERFSTAALKVLRGWASGA